MSQTLMEEKRNKLPHLTPLEKELLLELCTKYLHIIENKKIDFISSKEKSKCWEQIATEFSSTPNVGSRNDAQLRKCWDNIKYKAKKASCETIKQKVNVSVVHHDTFLRRVGTAIGISNEFESQNFISLVNEVKEDVTVSRNFTAQHEQGSTSKVSRSCKRKISEEGAPLIDDNESPISDLISEYATDDYEERRKEIELEHVKELHKLRLHQEKELHAIKMQTEKVKLKLQEEKLRHFKERCRLRGEIKSSDEEMFHCLFFSVNCGSTRIFLEKRRIYTDIETLESWQEIMMQDYRITRGLQQDYKKRIRSMFEKFPPTCIKQKDCSCFLIRYRSMLRQCFCSNCCQILKDN